MTANPLFVLHNLMFLGALQGIIFSGVAFFSQKFRSRSTFFLGMLMLTFSYNIIQNYLVASNIFSLDAYFEVFYIPFSSLYLVLFYLYVKSFLSHERKLQKSDYFLFIPFLIALTESVLEKIGFASGIFTDAHVPVFDYFRIGMETLNVAYSFVLIAASYKLILKTDNSSFRYEALPKPQIKWLKSMTILLCVLCIYWIVPLYFEFQGEIEIAQLYFYVLWIGLSLTIYVLGHFGLYHFGIFQERKKIHEFQILNSAKEFESLKETQPRPANKNKQDLERIILIEKGYLDCNLSLDSIAEKLALSKSYLSRIFNAEMGKSFPDYVNELRVEEAKNYLRNPEFANYTLIAIGLEAGFNSKTAFNIAFKKFTGKTPSQFRDLNRFTDI